MSWRTECGNQFHAGWCRHIVTGNVYLKEGVVSEYGIRPHKPMTQEELDRKRKSEEMFEARNHPIPLATSKNIALAVRQVASYQSDIQAARRKIMERAREIEAMDLIPDNWNDDGTVSYP